MSKGLRLAELVAGLSLATDLGMGQPLEQALRTCLIALSLGERAGAEQEQLAAIFYVALLRFLGCNADAHESARMAGGDDIALRAAIAPVLAGAPREFVTAVLPKVGEGSGPVRRARLMAGMLTGGRAGARAGLRAHCEVGENLAHRLGLPASVRAGLGAAFEQWNGGGLPNGLRGEAIPLAARAVFLARDIDILVREAGAEAAASVVRRRSGTAYDPALVAVLDAHAAEIVAAAAVTSPWDEVMRREPEPRPWIPEARLDSILVVFADFVDLKSPCTAGHSREVAALAGAGGDRLLARAGLVHDLGRTAVPNGIWDKPGPLTEGEWERVRLHPYYCERILGRVGVLSELARLAGMHHERMDGSGYHRGAARAEIPAGVRRLAAADAYQAMTQHRPHRPALSSERAAHELLAMAGAGSLDRDAVDAVLSAAGHRLKAARQAWPAGLSEREVEVLRLLCRGGTKKEVASALTIAPSTVDHHVRHIYEKAGVQSRAGATLFALEHDLLN